MEERAVVGMAAGTGAGNAAGLAAAAAVSVAPGDFIVCCRWRCS